MKNNEFGSVTKINTGDLNFPVDRITRIYGGFISEVKKTYEKEAKEASENEEKQDEEYKKGSFWKNITSIEESLDKISMDINLDSTPIKGLPVCKRVFY